MKRIKTAVFAVLLCMVTFEGFSQDVNIRVFPNPCISQTFIVKSDKVILKVEVLNVIGKVINRTENDNFDIKEVPVFIGKCDKGIRGC